MYKVINNGKKQQLIVKGSNKVILQAEKIELHYINNTYYVNSINNNALYVYFLNKNTNNLKELIYLKQKGLIKYKIDYYNTLSNVYFIIEEHELDTCLNWLYLSDGEPVLSFKGILSEICEIETGFIKIINGDNVEIYGLKDGKPYFATHFDINLNIHNSEVILEVLYTNRIIRVYSYNKIYDKFICRLAFNNKPIIKFKTENELIYIEPEKRKRYYVTKKTS